MAEVYAAYDPELDRKIALKFLRGRAPDGAGHDDGRLLLEAKAIARLSHPNVITVHDVGTLESRVFIAMEYVEGGTLSTWLTETSRSWAEIVTIFAYAARGLGAAHAANLVHRDFKPQNVMVGRNGVVRVMDFGLARQIDGKAPEQIADASATGSEIAGTPPFMAPEQLRGAAPDARSDQFSFSVALYRALYGEHPFFEGCSLAGLRAAVTAGRLRPPPANSTVPTWLRRVVARGLSARPDDRWPSMGQLVKALLANPAKGRRRLLRNAAAALLLCSVAATVGWASRREAQLCPERPERLGDAWNLAEGLTYGQRRDAVRAAFGAVGGPTASQAWERVSVLLDGYARLWLTMHRSACEATHVAREQSPEVLELRMACLEDRHQALGSLTRLLAAASSDVVEHAADAVRALPPLARCGDIPLLRAAGTASLGVQASARVTDLRRQAEAIRVSFDLGDEKSAVTRGRTLLAEARVLGHPPLIAEILLMLGRFAGDAGRYVEAETTLRESARVALSARRDDIAAEAYEVLGGALDCLPQESLVLLELAEALLDRTGSEQGRLRSWILHDRGNALTIAGDYQAALALLAEGLALKEKILAPDDPDIARTLMSQAEALHAMERDDEALPINARATRLLSAANGPSNVLVAMSLSNQGEYLLGLGRAAEALASLQDATERLQQTLGRDHRYLGFSLTAMGRALLRLGRAADARPQLERALRIREANELDATLTAETRSALAEALLATGDKKRAADMTAAAASRRRGEAPPRATTVSLFDGWLTR